MACNIIVKVKKLIFRIILILLVLLPGLFMSAHSYAAPNYDQIIADEAYWVSIVQLPTSGIGTATGAIPQHSDPTDGYWYVSPYDANIAAKGMLEHGCATTCTSSYYGPMVKKWMEWYFSHLNYSADYNNIPATVYDYRYKATDPNKYQEQVVTENGHGYYDSIDSYAATFISLARKYAETNSADTQFLINNQYNINQIVGAMQAMKKSDGLTWDKPDTGFRVKRLMDNVEVYTGFKDAAWLYQNVFNDPNYNYYNNHANEVKNGIQSQLWKPTFNMFSAAKHESGVTDDPHWSTWYPDATAQMWAIKEQVSDVAQTTTLWTTFNTTYPNWTTTINNPDNMPWAGLGLAAAVKGNKQKTNTFLNNVVTNRINGNPPHAWPWSVREAGYTAQTAKIGKNL